MPSDLGTRLVRAGLISRGQLADALASGARAGSALVAALVAGGLPEDALAGFFVAEGHGPLVDDTALENADEGLVARLPHAMADALCALPLAREDGAVILAMGDPTDAHALRELERVLEAPVRARVARYAALRRALARVASAAKGPEAGTKPAPASPRALEAPVPGAGAAQAPAEEVEEPAVALVRRKHAPAVAPQAPATSEDGDAQAVLLVRTKPIAAPTAPRVEAPAAAPSPAPSTAPAPAGPDARPSRPSSDSWASLDAGVASPESARPRRPAFLDDPGPATPPSRPRVATITAPPAASLPDPGPALAAVRAAAGRDEAVRLACAALAPAGRCAVFLALKKDVLQGRAVSGGAVSREAVFNLWIPVTSASIFRDAVTRGAVHFGPYGTAAADTIFRAAIDSPGGDAVVVPVVVGGKAVGVLACDDVRVGARGLKLAEQVAAVLGETLARVVASKRR